MSNVVASYCVKVCKLNRVTSSSLKLRIPHTSNIIKKRQIMFEGIQDYTSEIGMSLLIPATEAIMVPLLLMCFFTIVMKMALLVTRFLIRILPIR